MSRLDLTNVSGNRCSQSCMFNPLALRPPFSDRPWDVTACLRASTTSGSILECLVPKSGPTRPLAVSPHAAWSDHVGQIRRIVDLC